MSFASTTAPAGAETLTLSTFEPTILVLALDVPRLTRPAPVFTPARLTDRVPGASPLWVATENVPLDAPAVIVAVPDLLPACQEAATSELPRPPASATV